VWILNFAGVMLALYVFMADAIAAAHRGLDSIRAVLPERFNWELFGVALALMAAPCMKIGWQFFVLEHVKTANAKPMEEFRCTRSTKN
jgi:predicted Abi (CAAX) family protease